MTEDSRKADEASATSDESADEDARDDTDATAEQAAPADSGTAAEQDPADGDAPADTGSDNGSATADGPQAAESMAAAPAAPRPSRAPLLFAMLAAITAIVAIAGVAMLWLATPAPDTLGADNQAAIERLERQLAAATRDLEATSNALAEVRAASGDARTAANQLQSTLDERLRPLEAVPGRLSNIESSLSALQGISSGLRDTWLLSEAEYYLQIANAQLQLARNPALARTALELADERLVSLGNPALTDVRRAIADERRLIDAMETSDVEGAALTLASLADAIESLPLESDVVRQDTSAEAVSEELTGSDRALAMLKQSFSSVISVRRTDEPAKTLLPPDAAYFLRSNLTLQLQSARLALLRSERTLFEQSLADAAEWLAEYYDTDTTPVQSALATLDDLRDTRFTAAMPDISRSLALLRQYISLSSQERATSGSNDGSLQ